MVKMRSVFPARLLRPDPEVIQDICAEIRGIIDKLESMISITDNSRFALRVCRGMMKSAEHTQFVGLAESCLVTAKRAFGLAM